MPHGCDTPNSHISLVRAHNSKNGGAIGGFVGALSNAQHEQGLCRLIYRIDQSMAGFVYPDFVAPSEFARQRICSHARVLNSASKDFQISRSNSLI